MKRILIAVSDRRDGWVGLSSCPERFKASPGWKSAKPIYETKWRSSMSACRSVLENMLDTPDIVRNRDLSPIVKTPK
jgi:hypothetical protein